ncbi:MAG: metabolite traffic protein EboE [Pirellulales bacterium]
MLLFPAVYTPSAAMSLPPDLPLSYCTNVHPCRRASDVPTMLDRYTVPVRARCGFDIAAGLWLPAVAVEELEASPQAGDDLERALRERQMTCYTLNAFPFGDFHGERVKEQVYLPDWSDLRRRQYTERCARVLARLLGDTAEGSISTLPLGFRGFDHVSTFFADCCLQLLTLAEFLAELERQTGKCIRLAIEPEPFCLCETTSQTIEFFDQLRAAAARRGLTAEAERYLGICYDVCHQAVEFEDAGEAIGRLAAAGIRINKVQLSCAIEVREPSDPGQLAALRPYAEPRYLHQTFGRRPDGSVVRRVDLTTDFVSQPTDDFREASCWRVHFHVPVDAHTLGPLHTTRADLEQALRALGQLDYRPHLEVETYTWPVLPGADPVSLVEGLARELLAIRELQSADGDSGERPPSGAPPATTI